LLSGIIGVYVASYKKTLHGISCSGWIKAVRI
jgi:hypothetical protein